jgi:hypothetical protein
LPPWHGQLRLKVLSASRKIGALNLWRRWALSRQAKLAGNRQSASEAKMQGSGQDGRIVADLLCGHYSL